MCIFSTCCPTFSTLYARTCMAGSRRMSCRWWFWWPVVPSFQGILVFSRIPSTWKKSIIWPWFLHVFGIHKNRKFFVFWVPAWQRWQLRSGHLGFTLDPPYNLWAPPADAGAFTTLVKKRGTPCYSKAQDVYHFTHVQWVWFIFISLYIIILYLHILYMHWSIDRYTCTLHRYIVVL